MAFTALVITQLMVVLDPMVVLIAVPSIQADLDIAPEDGQWLLTIYSLTFGGLLLLAGSVTTAGANALSSSV